MTMATGAVAAETASAAPSARSAVHRSSGPARARTIGKPVRQPVPLRTRTFAGRTFTVAVDVLDRQGSPPATGADDSVMFIPLDGGDWLSADLTDGHGTATLPAGDYAVLTYVRTSEPDGTTSTTLVYAAKESITSAASLTLDARKGRKPSVAVDRPGAAMANLGIILTQRLGDQVETMAEPDTTDLYLTPTGSDADLTLRLQGQLTEKGSRTGSPYVYNVAAAFPGIPADPVLHARTQDLTAVHTRYSGEGGDSCGGTYTGVDWGAGLGVQTFTEAGRLPVTRTEYFTPGLTWTTDELMTTADCGFDFDTTIDRSAVLRYADTTPRTREWSAAPVGPAEGALRWSGGSEPSLSTHLLSSADGTAQSIPYMTGTSTLRNAAGTVVATSDEPGAAYGWTRPPDGRYTLTVDATRNAPWSNLATRQHIEWGLDIADADSLPLPDIRYRTSLDADSRAPAGADQPITLVPEHTDGVPTLQVSYDDGITWTKTPVTRTDAGFTAHVRNPSSGYVSLRASIPGVVDQTLIRAYAIR